MSRVELEDLIGAIYAAAAEPQGWTDVLRTVTELVSGCGAGLHMHSAKGTFGINIDYNLDPAALDAYVRYYHAINPLMAPLARVPAGAVVSDRGLLPREVMVNSEYDQGYGRAFDIGGSATMVLACHGQHQSCLGILHSRSAEPFSQEHLALLGRLTPHFQRAIAINRKFEALRAEKDVLGGTLDRLEMGVLLLDTLGKVLHANAAAEALLRRGDGLFAAHGKLCATDSATNNALEAFVREAVTGTGQRGGFLAVKRADRLRPLSVRVAPLPEGHAAPQGEAAARAIVFLTDPDAGARECIPAKNIMAAYALTPAESRVVAALAGGDSLKEAAGKLGITLVTARNHLTRAMAKTDTGRQAGLVHLLLSSRVPVR
jgi:DNA-binding CsgD family transcriptional regulator